MLLLLCMPNFMAHGSGNSQFIMDTCGYMAVHGPVATWFSLSEGPEADQKLLLKGRVKMAWIFSKILRACALVQMYSPTKGSKQYPYLPLTFQAPLSRLHCVSHCRATLRLELLGSFLLFWVPLKLAASWVRVTHRKS